MEAMACGCASVIADSIGINEFARNGYNSIIVPVRNSGALARAVVKIAGNRRLKDKLVENGLGTAKTFSYEAMCSDFTSFLR